MGHLAMSFTGDFKISNIYLVFHFKMSFEKMPLYARSLEKCLSVKITLGDMSFTSKSLFQSYFDVDT
jgi:hypothetical protein